MNLAAWTGVAFSYPPYINFSMIDGKLQITIRSEANPETHTGPGLSAVITLDPRIGKDLILQVLEKLAD